MKRLSVSLAFKSFADIRLLSFANAVLLLMVANTRYAILKPYLDALKIAAVTFNDALTLASQRTVGLTDDKNAAREALLKILLRIASRLEEMAEDDGNNPRVITDAGFEIRNTAKTAKEAVLELETPILAVKNLENRTQVAQATWKKTKNANNYALRLKVKSEATWQEPVFSNKGEYIFMTLKADTVYEFQIRAMLNDLFSDWSASVIIYVS